MRGLPQPHPELGASSRPFGTWKAEGSSGHQKSLAFEVEQADEGGWGPEPVVPEPRLRGHVCGAPGPRDKRSGGEGAAAGAGAAGHPSGKLRVGTSMVFKISMLSVIQTTLFT